MGNVTGSMGRWVQLWGVRWCAHGEVETDDARLLADELQYHDPMHVESTNKTGQAHYTFMHRQATR